MSLLRRFFDEMPIVAILRGLTPEEAPAALDVLVEAGIRIVEVPLNSPRPFETLRIFVERGEKDLLIGAGTVLSTDEAVQVAEIGARLMVAPNVDPSVIAKARTLGLATLPGVATPSEALTALKAGADGLKLFPSEMLPPKVLKAWLAVLPSDTLLVPVGGVSADVMAAYRDAGAAAFGIGSALYQPGLASEELGHRARALVERGRDLARSS
jgi:2-dehydro-3-deoxyphosphogalactonate aldolase